MIRKYCKAYYLKAFRQFSGWTEKREENEPELCDDNIVYLWDDFTVVRNPVLPEGVIFDEITPQWQDFCQTALQFKIPKDLQYTHKRVEEKESYSEEPNEELSQTAR